MGMRAAIGARAALGLLCALPALVALAPGRVWAQGQGLIRITEPAGWEGGQSYTLQAGMQLHVAGVTRQASGVRRVLIDGREARLQADPDDRSWVRFDILLAPDPAAREVTIVVEPGTGPPVARRYGLVVRAVGPVAGAPAGSGAPPQAAPRPDSGAAEGGEEIPTLPVVHLYLHQPSPWRPFTLRGIAYAGLMGAGLYLGSQKKSQAAEICTGPAGRQDCVDQTVVSRPNAALGMGVAAGAAAIGLIDVLLTSRRAHARQTEARHQPPGRTGLAPPAIETDGRETRLALLRLRF